MLKEYLSNFLPRLPLLLAYMALILSILPWKPYLGGLLGFGILAWLYYDDKKYKRIPKESINHPTKICLTACLLGFFLYGLCLFSSAYKLYVFEKEIEKNLHQVLSNESNRKQNP